MNTNKKTTRILEDVNVNVKIKLAALWAASMSLYIYVDYFYLYVPGTLEEIIAGKMGPFPTTQVSLLLAMTLMMIPGLMIFLSLALKAKWNRWTNIIVGILKIVVVLGAIIGESWAFYIFATIVEVVLLSLIVWYAWKWPKQEA
jgi:hypothetical protein